MMRNKLKLFGIIAAVAVIGFSVTGCGDGAGGGGGGGSGGNNNPTPVAPGSPALILEAPVFTMDYDYDADEWLVSPQFTRIAGDVFGWINALLFYGQNEAGGTTTRGYSIGTLQIWSGEFGGEDFEVSVGRNSEDPRNGQVIERPNPVGVLQPFHTTGHPATPNGFGTSGAPTAFPNIFSNAVRDALEVEPANATLFRFQHFRVEGGGRVGRLALVHESGSMTGTNSATYESVEVHHVYVGNDVTVSLPDDIVVEGQVVRTHNAFTIQLRRGWNAVYFRTSQSITDLEEATGTETVTTTTTTPNLQLRWVYFPN